MKWTELKYRSEGKERIEWHSKIARHPFLEYRIGPEGNEFKVMVNSLWMGNKETLELAKTLAQKDLTDCISNLSENL